MDSIAFYWVFSWLISTVWMGVIGARRSCGFAPPFFASLLCGMGIGTILAGVILILSEKK